jgi:hypothetical protein
MKHTLLIILAVFSAHAAAARPDVGLPGCNLDKQHALAGETGGQITDIRQAHISMRANILSADISTLRKALKITQVEADRMSKRVEDVRRQNNLLVTQQGFLSAAEKASFDREFDAIAHQLCKQEKLGR